MTKIAILGDLHLGVRNDNVSVRNAHLRYLSEVFIPYCLANNIENIIQVGDVFDRRKYTNHITLYHWEKKFFNVLQQHDIKFYMILGNHDIVYKNTLEINAPELMLASKYSNIELISEPCQKLIAGFDFLFLPWICESNEEQTLNAIKNSTTAYAIGHLELAGFEMQRGQISDHGMDANLFSNFDLVITGHYHHKSHIGNIFYIGTPYEMTWADYEDPRGFFIFDTDTRLFSFEQNKTPLFHKIYYDDSKAVLTDYTTVDLTMYKDTYVKLIVNNKSNPYMFDIYVERLEKNGVVDLQIIDTSLNLTFENDMSILPDEVEDTGTILGKYVDQMDVKQNKEVLKLYLGAIFKEALNRE